MLTNIYFVKDNEDVLRICATWLHTSDVAEIAYITGLRSDHVEEQVARLKKIGILLGDKKLDTEVQKYMETVIASEMKKMKGT
jgi:hypothetical protein